MKRLWWSLICVLALGGVSACDNGDDPGDADSGTPDMTDAGGEAQPLVLASVRDSAGELTDQVPADLSCAGTRMEPTGEGESTFTLKAVDFQDGFAVEGLMIQFFPNNMPTADGSCEAPCQTVTTDAAGEATVTDTAGSWYAYRVLAGEGTSAEDGTTSDFIGVVQVNEEAPADGGEGTANVVRAASRDTIVVLLGTSAVEGTAVVTGQGADCMGRQLANATLRLFDSEGEIETGFTGTGAREFYFSNMFPSGAAEMTSADGLYGTANIPLPADNQIRAELWGVTTEGGAPEMLGCELVQVSADGITIINIGPTRADGPSGCSGS